MFNNWCTKSLFVQFCNIFTKVFGWLWISVDPGLLVLHYSQWVSEVRRKTITTRSHIFPPFPSKAFSATLFASSFDWSTGFSVSFVTGQNLFYFIQMKMILLHLPLAHEEQGVQSSEKVWRMKNTFLVRSMCCLKYKNVTPTINDSLLAAATRAFFFNFVASLSLSCWRRTQQNLKNITPLTREKTVVAAATRDTLGTNGGICQSLNDKCVQNTL